MVSEIRRFFDRILDIVTVGRGLLMIIGLLVLNELLDIVKNGFQDLDVLERMALVLVIISFLVILMLIASSYILPNIVRRELKGEFTEINNLLKNPKVFGIRVFPVEDSKSPIEEGYENKVYKQLLKEVSDPNIHSIRILSVAAFGTGRKSDGENKVEAYNDEWRVKYLERLNTLICEKAVAPEGFTYIRVYQKSPEEFDQDPKNVNSVALEKHVDVLRKLHDVLLLTRGRRKKTTIFMGVVPTTRNTGFMIINENRLLVFISAVFEQDGQSIPYISGLHVFENQFGEAQDMINEYLERLNTLHKTAKKEDSVILEIEL